MPKKLTHEEYVQKVKENLGEEYVVLSNYNGQNKKILVKHNSPKCNYREYEVTAGNLLDKRKRGCKACSGSLKKTTFQFAQEVEFLTDGEYKLIGEYNGNKTNTEFLHQNEMCMETFKMMPNSFLNGQRCSHCNRKDKRSTEQYKKEVYEIVGEEYTVLGEYLSALKSISMKHNTCGNQWMVNPNNFLSNGTRCPKCSKKEGGEKRVTSLDTVKKRVFDLVKNEYKVIKRSETSNTKVILRHEKCGNTYEIYPTSFFRGTRCRKCQHRSYKKTTKEFNKEVIIKGEGKYVLLSEYVNNKTKVLMRHTVCGENFSVSPSDFISGVGCSNCFKKTKRSQSEFENIVCKLGLGEYEVLSSYVTAMIKVKVLHNICGNTFYVTPNDFIHSGTRCKCTSESKGEKKVRMFLECNYVSYESQYRFDNCRNVNPLPFDFAIFNSENSLECLIEYDGKQHFKPVRFGGVNQEKAEGNFITTKKRDQIKNQYCKDNNIPLIRIPYWDFDDIETILEKELAALGIIKEELIEPVLT